MYLVNSYKKDPPSNLRLYPPSSSGNHTRAHRPDSLIRGQAGPRNPRQYTVYHLQDPLKTFLTILDCTHPHIPTPTPNPGSIPWSTTSEEDSCFIRGQTGSRDTKSTNSEKKSALLEHRPDLGNSSTGG